MSQQQIYCSIKNCHYWASGNVCQAEAILVTSDTVGQSLPEALGTSIVGQVPQSPVSSRSESRCQTFIERAAFAAQSDEVRKV